MFSWALLEALSQGDSFQQEYLSLREVTELTANILHDRPERNAPRPALHSPDQSQGDVADIPFFPNLLKNKEEDRLSSAPASKVLSKFGDDSSAENKTLTDAGKPQKQKRKGSFGDGSTKQAASDRDQEFTQDVQSPNLSSNGVIAGTYSPVNDVNQVNAEAQPLSTEQFLLSAQLPPVQQLETNIVLPESVLTEASLVVPPISFDQERYSEDTPSDNDQGTRPVRICYCLTQEDRRTLIKIEAHLSPIYRSGLAEGWHEGMIELGTESSYAIRQHLKTADLILILLNASFLASDEAYARGLEALQQYEVRRAHIIPILLRPTDFSRTPFAPFVIYPRNGRPISQWRNREAAYADVAKDVGEVVEQIRADLQRSDTSPVPNRSSLEIIPE